jgi:hypothetical protein
MGNNYNLLVDKINEFTRKFYLNKLLRGSIYVLASILIAYLLLFVTTYYAKPNITAKTIIFFLFILLTLAVTIIYIVIPISKYLKLSKTISLEQAAMLIGDHFFNIKDRLLNTLQLHELALKNPENNHLILAGIDQKINELKPVPFAKAINFGDNKRYIKYIFLPVAIILCIALIAPAILTEGTKSFINYNKEIIPPAPFQFVLTNKNLNITQGDDFTANLKLVGDEFPQDVYVQDGLNTYKLEKNTISQFAYTFKNVQSDKTLKFFGGGFNSKSTVVRVRPRPQLSNLSASLVFPNYINRKKEQVTNAGDMLVPEGTKITWQITAENTEEVDFILQNFSRNIKVDDGKATFTAIAKNNASYRVVPKNGFTSKADSISHQISVISDQYPTIAVEEKADSLSTKTIYFSGKIADDYGFSSLKFNLQINKDGKIIRKQALPIAIKNNQLDNTFFKVLNFEDFNIQPGETLSYFFEVADNDGVNGAKKSRSEIKTLQAPNQQQIATKMAEGSEALKKKMDATIKLANTIEKESKKLSQNLLDKKTLNFEDKKQIEQLLNKQKDLQKALNDIKEQNEKNNFSKEENKALNDELKEKQKQINDLFNNALNDKTKDLLKKLQELMEMNNKDLTQEQLSKMQMDNKSLKNELDRILELYKQLDFEQQLQHKMDRLNDLAKEQQKMSEQSKGKNEKLDDLKNKQEQLNKDFQDLKKELKSLEQKNQELEKPNNFKNPENQSKQIEQKQQESKKQLDKNNKQKAAEQQEQAAEEMEKMAQQMSQDQENGEEEEDKVNVKDLRKLLENLLASSFEQEKTMLFIRKMNTNDPSYVSGAQQQNAIKDNMKTITDSLFSLSKRVPQLQSVVNTEVDKINLNVAKSIENLAERRTAEANRYQQFTMTSMNNLALMLNEALEQMQDKKGGGKGKGKKQSMKQLQQMQEQLNKNMQQAREKMQQQGNQGTVPKGQMSQEFAKMAQQQQMIREALHKINKEDNKDGKGAMGNLNQTIQEMKKTEMDLVNKKLTQETLNRQKDLTVKLLEAEKAQREQDQSEKRESNAAKQFPPSYQKMLDQFNKQFKPQTEAIQKLPPNLNYYYKNKIAEYFKLLNLPSK